jgi:hypothetical protein
MKKRYYRLDNGDTPVIDASLSVLMDIIESETADYKNQERYDEDSRPEWAIDLVWLTDEEFANLEDA